MKYILGIACFSFGLLVEGAELPRSGSSTKITPYSATIDRSFIEKLRANPDANSQEWGKWGATYAELGYFLLAGDEKAVEATIQYVLHNKKHRDDYDDHYGLQEVATLLSLSPRFGYVLEKTKPSTCKALAEYYTRYKSDYAVPQDAPWTTEWCIKK